MTFTSRPEIRGRFGVVAATHWLAAQTAMRMLELGGNAFDAAAAGGFVLQIAEPHLNGPGGDAPILFWSAGARHARVICGQGPAPRRATIAHMRGLGIDLIPGTGLLPAVVPGAFDAWMALVAGYGTMDPAAILAPAIEYAEAGVPALPRLAATLAALETIFRRDWPDSAALHFRCGIPQPGTSVANPTLAATWRRLAAAAAGGTRAQSFDAIRAAWSDGFVAEAIDAYCARAAVVDITGRAHGACLRGDDLAGWRAPEEQPTALPWRGRSVLKCGPWSQGPAFQQMLAMVDSDARIAGDPAGADFVHLLVEAAKLAFADRETFYGDPDQVEVPLDRLLDPAYAAQRRGAIGERASAEFRPGAIPGFGRPPDFAAALGRKREDGLLAAYGAGEPTFSTVDPVHRPTALVGDTSSIVVADRFGNMVAATPSGGWLQASPAIPELGFCLGTRGQSFWLDEGHPNALAPGKRPRTTLTPTLVLDESGPVYASASPGGDQQDQWQLQVMLRHFIHGLDLQAAIDHPTFHAEQWPSSFYPRGAVAQAVKIEERFPAATLEALAARGHAVKPVQPWSEGRVCAVAADGGWLKAAASPRGQQAYAVGR